MVVEQLEGESLKPGLFQMLSALITGQAFSIASNKFFDGVKKWGIFAAITIVMLFWLLWHQISDQKFIREELMAELRESNRTRATLEKTLDRNSLILEGCAAMIHDFLEEKQINHSAQLE